MRLFGFFVLLLSLILFFPGAAFAQHRVALVIGMSKYQEVPRLKNPERDAKAIASLFRKAGFDLVDEEHDLGIADLRRVVRQFAESTRDADIAIVYYAGHGMEIDGNNFLIPADAQLLSDFDVEDETMSLDRVMKALEPVKRLKLIILDACRDNPFAKTMKRTLSSRSIGRGLAEIEPGNSDTLIAFAAKAGAVASDGDGQDSPFTIALIKHLTEPGLDLRIAFGRVRDDVLKATANRQEPFVYGSLGGDTMALVPKPVDPDAEARVDYELAAQVGTKEAWDSFLGKHGSGYFADLARAQSDKLSAAQEVRAKADDARRDAESQAAQKAADYRKQLEEQSAQETAEIKRKLAEQAKRDLDDARHQVEIAQQQAEAARAQLEEAKRQGAAEAKIQIEQQAAAAKPESQRVAAPNPNQPPPQNAPNGNTTGVPQMDPSDIARLLQAHLKRVGCNSGSVDGNWDDGSKKALALFNKNAHADFDIKVASLDALEAVRTRTDRVCPLVCAKGQKIDGDRCVPIACGSGEFLNSSGICEKKSEPRRPERAVVRHEPAAPRASGSKCFSFGGKSYCE